MHQHNIHYKIEFFKRVLNDLHIQYVLNTEYMLDLLIINHVMPC